MGLLEKTRQGNAFVLYAPANLSQLLKSKKFGGVQDSS